MFILMFFSLYYSLKSLYQLKNNKNNNIVINIFLLQYFTKVFTVKAM